MITITPPSSFKKLAWKNGKGFTTELAINANGNLDGFEWRLSIATVSENGAFSNFSGYERNLVLIEGGGITLEHHQTDQDIQTDHLVELLDFATFDGAAKTLSSLHSGAIKDFNIMTDTNKCRADVKTFKANQSISINDCDECFVYSLSDVIKLFCQEKLHETIKANHLLRLEKPLNGQYRVESNQFILVRLKEI